MYQFHWIVVEMFHSKTQPYGGAGGKTKMITSISGDRPLKNMNVSKVSIDVELSYAPLQVNSFHTLLLCICVDSCLLSMPLYLHTIHYTVHCCGFLFSKAIIIIMLPLPDYLCCCKHWPR